VEDPEEVSLSDKSLAQFAETFLYAQEMCFTGNLGTTRLQKRSTQALPNSIRDHDP
jgi:hypothetical protein